MFISGVCFCLLLLPLLRNLNGSTSCGLIFATEVVLRVPQPEFQHVDLAPNPTLPKKTPVFVFSLIHRRPNATRELELAWLHLWPELSFITIRSFEHKLRGLGLTISIIQALESAYYDNNFPFAIFFEDDARPFATVLARNYSLNQYFYKLLDNWEIDSPILFLGAHHISANINISNGLSDLHICLGSYAWVARRNYFLVLAKLLRKSVSEAGIRPLSPDVLLSKFIDKTTLSKVATPLLVDHKSGQFSDTWHFVRGKSTWEGQPYWWKIPSDNHSKPVTLKDEIYISDTPRVTYLGKLLSSRNLTRGAELGVQRGLFAAKLLDSWIGVKSYLLVDIWASLQNNVANRVQDRIYETAINNTQKWPATICRNFTHVCSKLHHNSTFDFIYLDAHHDNQGATIDIENWFPLLKPSGVIAGHDYITADDQYKLVPSNKWWINEDGSMDVTKRGVVGAVDDYFGLLNYHLHVVDNKIPWKTWVIDTSSRQSQLIPKTFHFIWINTNCTATQSEIPAYVLNNIKSWKNLHPHWYTVVWTNMLVKKHFPELFRTIQKVKHAAWAADLIRYAVLAKFGGIYVDTDIVALRNIENLAVAPFTVCERYYTNGSCQYVCNAVISSMKNSTLMDRVLLHAMKETEKKISHNSSNYYDVKLTGPVMWSKYALSINNNVTVLPRRSFYPCYYTDKSQCVAEKYVNDVNVYAMHTWEKSWK